MCRRCMRPSYGNHGIRSSNPPESFPETQVRLVAESVLACTECENELERTPGGGAYCGNCSFHPSMQDTFFFYRCPNCRSRLRAIRQMLTCPECQTRCAKP